MGDDDFPCDNCHAYYSELELLKRRCADLRATVSALKTENANKDKKIDNQRKELKQLVEKNDALEEQSLQHALEKKNLITAYEIMKKRYLAAERFIESVNDERKVMCLVEMPKSINAADLKK